MTRDDIIRMAQQTDWDFGFEMTVEQVCEFAELVAAAEREACAKMIDRTDLSGLKSDLWLQNYTAMMLSEYAKAIRARGQE